MTLQLATMSPLPPAKEHAALAAARVPQAAFADPAALKAAAKQLGMKAVGENQYQHPVDGSWVALDGKKPVRGVGAQRFQGAPVDLAKLPVLAVGAKPGIAAQSIAAKRPGAALTGQLAKMGFSQASSTYWVHPDQSWVAITKDLGVVRGVGNRRLDPADVFTPGPPSRTGAQPRKPDDVLNFKRVAPRADDGFYACAQPGFLQAGNKASDAAALKKLGFKESTPGLFTHADGSWLAYTSQNRIERGAGNVVFQRVPLSPQRMSTTAPGPQHLSLAIAQPKIAALTPTQVMKGDKALVDAGFTQVRPGMHQHADGSFVTAAGGKVHLGVKQTVLSAAPVLSNVSAKNPDLKAIVGASTLWDLPTAKSQLRRALLDKGFVEARAGFYQDAPNKRWIAVDGDTLRVGIGSSVYDGIPSPQALPKKKSAPAHAFVAIAQTSGLKGGERDFAKQLEALGFADKGGGLHAHKDGSWVLQGADGGLLRGHNGQAFTDVPKPPKPGSYQVFATKPPGNWAKWRQQFAIARLPLFQGQFTKDQAAKVLTKLGFVENGTNDWHHPDGSVLKLAGDPPRFSSSKFQKWGFADFPYQNYPDGNTMQTLTQKWLSWAQGRGQPPY